MTDCAKTVYGILVRLITKQLEKPVIAKGNVELWLGELLTQSMSSLHAVIRDAYVAINDAGFSLMTFLNQFPSQVRFKIYPVCYLPHLIDLKTILLVARSLVLTCIYSFVKNT